jgi:hypothetical protein
VNGKWTFRPAIIVYDDIEEEDIQVLRYQEVIS